ncbi:MAG: hypothetical protein A2V85_13720 [Chloroflexi bacterium RBG_16_72_14]|nr:MAG: hypothetical protein A2V85_13720 [Chloroflexi bacterium RBG_16_72_14]
MKLTRMTRTAGWLAVAGLLSAALIAPTAASAASVAPEPINEGNPTCGSFNASWTQLKVEPPANGEYTDGTLIVTITNFAQSDAGTPGSFDWASNIGVDAVFVKAGSDKHNLYQYSPEATSDTDLGPQAGTGNGISHISFCYDVETTTTTTETTDTETTDTTTTDTTTTDTTTTETTTTDTQTTETETTETETTETSTTETTPEGSVEAETGTPDVTPPSTDTGSISGPSSPSGSAWQLLLVAMAGLLATVLLLTPAAEARKR